MTPNPCQRRTSSARVVLCARPCQVGAPRSCLTSVSAGCRNGNAAWAPSPASVHFFDRWPLPATDEFLGAFPQDGVAAAVTGRPAAPGGVGPPVLVDASSRYLLTAAAAPRIQRVAPDARFVIVLQVRAAPACHVMHA